MWLHGLGKVTNLLHTPKTVTNAITLNRSNCRKKKEYDEKELVVEEKLNEQTKNITQNSTTAAMKTIYTMNAQWCSLKHVSLQLCIQRCSS